ncbi:related to Yippee protein [Melanopsichium pennsylvanicum]|uniref:Protein yippee-like n=1 Tax=Melanopsichium pennsylvanicum TaxID=63383 RepID=A0AAJ4XLG1_9BASI|nr:related to Yippee protein [Melanopsichium pennsylvanicum]
MASPTSSQASSSSSYSTSASIMRAPITPTTPTTTPTSPMLDWLPYPTPRYVCADCGAHLALQDELISKSFSGRDGKAYLFASTLNTCLGNKEDRHLLTGIHTVCDLSCKGCGKTLGWYYCKAWEQSQKYKEGKWIMEKIALSKVNAW